ncbi:MULTISPECIES: class I adenylate-forming enzyme family protein [unclassified Novosphingobium]|uniref:class I adenylate-forming enzyme family protein n=1 Tax=unclassified Novosphingobium TaxID=2644732 RepID=UPI0025FAB072|nr:MULTISPECIES: class I adenylate-forming enzyme family protein [unclassified Novosphingobium]HQV03275.1 class I adenylate-forming enzyme family protein [Novosphingobium sp.]
MASDPAAQLDAEFGSFPGLIAAWGAWRGDAPALYDGTTELSWRETAARVERIAARLQADGLERGQSVAILGTTSVNYALIYLAAIRAGGCAAPLTTSASPDQLAGMAADSGAIHLFIDRAKLNELGDFKLPVAHQIVLDEELDTFMASEGTKAAPFEPAEKDPFNIIYSSGTTGIPKGIVHSHGMRWRQMTFRAALNYGQDSRTICSTPLYSNTTMAVFLPTMYSGGCASLMGKFDVQKWLERASAEQCTHTMLVPVQYRRLMQFEHFDDYDLSAMRMKYCTSAPFPADLKAEVLKRMPGGLIEIYGMTEGGVACIFPVHEHPDKLHTVGKPAPGHFLKVIDENLKEVPPGTPGELVGISPTMMLGYKNQPEKTREGYWINPEDGSTWQRMGDIGRVDADGFVELVGRTKDVIISGGFNIFPIDLEAELAKDERVVEAAVVGVPSEAWGETPVGFVVLKPGVSEDALEDIRSVANSRLGKTQRVAELYAIAEMPRSHIGKLLKTDLRELVPTKAR